MEDKGEDGGEAYVEEGGRAVERIADNGVVVDGLGEIEN